jgi:hypothetical protein
MAQPLVFLLVGVLFWTFVLRAILRRRRQSNDLPMHNPSAQYPDAQYGNANPYVAPNNGHNGYTYGQQNMTQYPQQSYVAPENNGNTYGAGQQQYAPPPGKPPHGM